MEGCWPVPTLLSHWFSQELPIRQGLRLSGRLLREAAGKGCFPGQESPSLSAASPQWVNKAIHHPSPRQVSKCLLNTTLGGGNLQHDAHLASWSRTGGTCLVVWNLAAAQMQTQPGTSLRLPGLGLYEIT